MSEDYAVVKADFDEIALLDEPKWNHNNCYFPLLLRALPERCDRVLDIGCGKGELSALLARQSRAVTAVDLSEVMLERARQTHSAPNIEYIRGNILDMDFPDGSLDAIVTTATAHHLPYEWLLRFARDKLKPGGTLAILDLIRTERWWETLYWGAAAVPNAVMNLLKNGRLQKDDPHAAALWDKHGAHDVYMSFSELRAAARVLPGAKLRRRLFWRYTLMWTKPEYQTTQ